MGVRACGGVGAVSGPARQERAYRTAVRPLGLVFVLAGLLGIPASLVLRLGFIPFVDGSVMIVGIYVTTRAVFRTDRSTRP